MLLEKGVSENYFYFLDKTFEKAVARAKSLFFDDHEDCRLSGISWIYEVTGEEEQPILSLNQFCLDRGVNALCFSRISIGYPHLMLYKLCF